MGHAEYEDQEIQAQVASKVGPWLCLLEGLSDHASCYGSTATLGESRIRSARDWRVFGTLTKCDWLNLLEKVCARHRVNPRRRQPKSDSRPFLIVEKTGG